MRVAEATAQPQRRRLAASRMLTLRWRWQSRHPRGRQCWGRQRTSLHGARDAGRRPGPPCEPSPPLPTCFSLKFAASFFFLDSISLSFPVFKCLGNSLSCCRVERRASVTWLAWGIPDQRAGRGAQRLQGDLPSVQMHYDRLDLPSSDREHLSTGA